METSILDTIKQMLGIEKECTAFDPEIIVHINSVFMFLSQLGIGNSTFYLTGSNETCNEIFESSYDYEAAKTYMYLKVRLAFDPPSNSFVVDSMERQCSEYEWRLYANAETLNNSDGDQKG